MNTLRVRPRNALIVLGVFLVLSVYGVVYLGRQTSTPPHEAEGTRVRDIRFFSGIPDSLDLPGKLSPSRLLHDWGTIPIVVVEEHHEVLPYWFSAIKDGTLSSKGNTLIHIDGHSDAAPPIFLEGYPRDFYPRTSDELRTMMQRNDAFIMEAVMSGVISRYVWIWPKWDSANHEEPYEAGIMLLGVVSTVYKSLGETPIKSCCMCEAEADMKPVSRVAV